MEQCFACELEATFATNQGAGGITKACLHCAETSDVPMDEWVLLDTEVPQ